MRSELFKEAIGEHNPLYKEGFSHDQFYKGAEWAWHHQQSKIDELQKRVDDLTQVMEELLEEMKYPTATFEEVICSGVRELEQALKGESNG